MHHIRRAPVRRLPFETLLPSVATSYIRRALFAIIQGDITSFGG